MPETDEDPEVILARQNREAALAAAAKAEADAKAKADAAEAKRHEPIQKSPAAEKASKRKH